MVLRVIGVTETDVHGDHHSTTNDAHSQKYVSTHSGEAQENYGIQTHGFHERVFSGTQHGHDPGENAFSRCRWRMFVIGVLYLGGVHDLVMRTNDGEEQGEQNSKSNRGTKREPDRIHLELHGQLASLNFGYDKLQPTDDSKGLEIKFKNSSVEFPSRDATTIMYQPRVLRPSNGRQDTATDGNEP